MITIGFWGNWSIAISLKLSSQKVQVRHLESRFLIFYKLPPSNGIGTYLGCSNVDPKKNKTDFGVIKNKLVHQLAS